MHKLSFYPLGNADCCLIELANNKSLLIDYADTLDKDDSSDKRIDLSKTLKEILKKSGKDYFDVVAFSHLDKDHVQKANEFFYLEYATQYQSEDRIKINELWVPAAAIVDGTVEEEAWAIRQEARYRLKEGKGIRVFSRPQQLENWLKENGLTIEDRKNLITDAGQLAPGFSIENDNVEFFVHSPFACRQEDSTVIDRNGDSLVLQVIFSENNEKTKLLLGSDLTNEAIADIVNITKYHNNEERLEWDIFKLPHHCSYKALANDKGKDITEPIEEAKWLFEEQSIAGGIMISTSKPIPTNDEDAQPPHRQAANYYKKIAENIGGEFIVPMEHPNKIKPEPVKIEITENKAKIEKKISYGSSYSTTQQSPRAGYGY